MIDSKVFLYQGRAEPVLVPAAAPATPAVSSWGQPTVTPVRRVTSIALIASSFFFVPVVQAAAPVAPPLDGWSGQYPGPRAAARRVIDSGSVDVLRDIAVVAVPSIDSWGSQTTWARFRETLTIADGSFHVPFEEITIDKWYTRSEVPVVRKPWVRGGQWSSFIDPAIAPPEVITLDKWEPSYQDILPRAKPRPITGPEFAPPLDALAAEVLTIDKWGPEYPDIIFRIPVRPRTGPEFAPTLNALAVEVITLDKWWQPTSEPRRGPKLLSVACYPFWSYTDSAIVPPEVITIDKWWVRTSEPTPRRQGIRTGIAQHYAYTERDIVAITWTTYGGPFLYTAANWSTSTQFFFEAYFRAAAGTCRARLVNQSGTPVSGSEVTTSSAAHVRLRSGAVTLVDGSEYFAQFGEETGATGFFLLARVIGI